MSVPVIVRVIPNKPKKGDVAKLMFLVKHPMDPGTIKDPKTGKLIPANYITTIDISLNGQKIATIKNGPGVSSNPIFGLDFKAIEAGTVKMVFTDNHGKSFEHDFNLELS
ncbi:Sulphur oxidation protein SoxZ [Hydrogenobaculum sp. Y04AAS1]|uniref:thiosulfate oxidation carrier complex protein SoxZ n=1 Tax=Hydrogenobaculum sp. (strain Y04AAS1) TaxID=380749 RepID=UPI00015BC915|nr:Sulphur oxidation protein SoxZ [Hydrogenobaculum sp. Y04AAS1]HCT66993.1 thiosulfate oxidation carrier complex protein SoxZ [Hydrogenobaculum sp.]